jgi:hypothetical protein
MGGKGFVGYGFGVYDGGLRVQRLDFVCVFISASEYMLGGGGRGSLA